MIELLRDAAIAVGLETPARRAWRYCRSVVLRTRARGLLPWTALVPEQEFSACVQRGLARLETLERRGEFGDYLEFGVSRGTSMACVHDVLRDQGLPSMRMIGFDSFEGLPPDADKEGWAPGDFHSTLDATQSYLSDRGVSPDRISLVVGWFADTLNERTLREHRLDKASLIMVDCDIYSASAQALAFCAPLIRSHAVIMFDDWASNPAWPGQKEAFAEFLQQHPQLRAEPLESYSPNARVFLVSRLAS